MSFELSLRTFSFFEKKKYTVAVILNNDIDKVNKLLPGHQLEKTSAIIALINPKNLII
tara:strand:- start:47 stop:220 length:174 start_codon:yes stop_codon:yes gene_type:complete